MLSQHFTAVTPCNSSSVQGNRDAALGAPVWKDCCLRQGDASFQPFSHAARAACGLNYLFRQLAFECLSRVGSACVKSLLHIHGRMPVTDTRVVGKRCMQHATPVHG